MKRKHTTLSDLLRKEFKVRGSNETFQEEYLRLNLALRIARLLGEDGKADNDGKLGPTYDSIAELLPRRRPALWWCFKAVADLRGRRQSCHSKTLCHS
jgi:hypothetical protein